MRVLFYIWAHSRGLFYQRAFGPGFHLSKSCLHSNHHQEIASVYAAPLAKCRQRVVAFYLAIAPDREIPRYWSVLRPPLLIWSGEVVNDAINGHRTPQSTTILFYLAVLSWLYHISKCLLRILLDGAWMELRLQCLACYMYNGHRCLFYHLRLGDAAMCFLSQNYNTWTCAGIAIYFIATALRPNYWS